MLMRTPRPEKMAIDKRKKVLRNEPETAHLDKMLDEALRETFPASDPIAITIDKPLKAVASEEPLGPDTLAPSLRTTAGGTEPKPTLVGFYDANLWGFNQIFDWWSLLLGVRRGK
jgi:hypothetical protein